MEYNHFFYLIPYFWEIRELSGLTRQKQQIVMSSSFLSVIIIINTNNLIRVRPSVINKKTSLSLFTCYSVIFCVL